MLNMSNFSLRCRFCKVFGYEYGTLLRRTMKRLPKERCWFVGCNKGDSLDIALKFNDAWETDWKFGICDCRIYANGLVERLTGEKHVLERLRRRTPWLL
ncbi:uncharacterized protein J3R85_002965 [Psidium guajava]|nr:uncharacterized protein J3R85_002965 [Psidium guajava]